MSIAFAEQDILMIYAKFRVELIQLEILAEAPQNAIDPISYQQEMDLLRSVTEKIEAVYPKFLEKAGQASLRKMAERKLLNH